MQSNTDMVNILEALDSMDKRIFRIKEIFCEMNFEVNQVYLYKIQAKIFTEFINRFGIVNSLTDELKDAALPNLFDEMQKSAPVLIYFYDDFSDSNMLYTYTLTNYPSVEILGEEYTVIAVDPIPVIDANKPLA